MTRLRQGPPTILLLVVAFVGVMTCRGRDEGVAGQSDSGGTTLSDEHRLLELVHEPWTGDLDGMLERRLIRVLVLPSRTTYILDGGKPRGIATEYQAALEQFINKRFPPKERHLKTSVVLMPTSRERALQNLLDGRGDILAGSLTVTEEREERVRFSEPTTTEEVSEIVVTGPSSPEVEKLEDLAGQEVFVRKSSSYWEHLDKLNERFRKDRLKPIRLIAAPEELQDEDLLELVNAGALDAIVVDDYRANLMAQVLPKLRLHADIPVHSGGHFAWMMRADSAKLADVVNEFLKGHRQGTSFGNTVIRRYLGNTKFIRNSTAPGEVEKFDAVFGLFEKYGERYELDPLLLTAQGYQESGLDQGVRSRAGAVGIMQVLPSTGAELGVGNVRELEPNIHAAAKYLRQIIDGNFADDSISELDRTLLAFASYNGGPNRIASLRKKAPQQGFDPNVWFGNVEYVVARSVGAEPVTYVSNIFKYYVSFKNLQREREAQARAREDLEKSLPQ